MRRLASAPITATLGANTEKHTITEAGHYHRGSYGTHPTTQVAHQARYFNTIFYAYKVSTTEEEITFVIRIMGGAITEITILLDLMVILIILENIIVSMVVFILGLLVSMV